jgi:acyl carrier protein
MEKAKIFSIIIENVKSLVDTFPANEQFEVSEKTILFGNSSQIDSLSLVSVIVDLEMIFLDDYEMEISLTDDRAMTREISPFDNISNLGDYIYELVNEDSNPK